MGTIPITHLRIGDACANPNSGVSRLGRRRRIGPEAGRALEILGHSIDYLVDELVHEGGSLSAAGGENAAIRLLMDVNREVYLACPEIPTSRERLSALCAQLVRRTAPVPLTRR